MERKAKLLASLNLIASFAWFSVLTRLFCFSFLNLNCLRVRAGGKRRRPSTSCYAGQLVGQLQRHRPGAHRSGCTGQAKELAQTGHTGRCLLPMHAKHFRRYPIHSNDVDHRNGGRCPGILHHHHVLHLRKWLIGRFKLWIYVSWNQCCWWDLSGYVGRLPMEWIQVPRDGTFTKEIYVSIDFLGFVELKRKIRWEKAGQIKVESHGRIREFKTIDFIQQTFHDFFFFRRS